MKNSKYCNTSLCCWNYRFELVGLVLLVLATILTIITLNGFGIAAMFFVGMILCAHKCLCCKRCHPECKEEAMDLAIEEIEAKIPAKKSTKKPIDKM